MTGILLANPQDSLALDQWATVVSAFGVKKVHHFGDHIPFDWKKYRFIRDAKPASTITSPIVLVQSPHGRLVQGEDPLQSFEHPEDCVYLFGPDHGILEVPEDMEIYSSIYIPTPEDLYSFVVGGIVLYDRLVKSG